MKVDDQHLKVKVDNRHLKVKVDDRHLKVEVDNRRLSALCPHVRSYCGKTKAFLHDESSCKMVTLKAGTDKRCGHTLAQTVATDIL